MTRKLIALGTVLGGLFLAAPQVQAGGHNYPAWAAPMYFGLAMADVFFRAAAHVPAPVCAPAPCAPVVVSRPVYHAPPRVPIYNRVWVSARYNRVFYGYDRFHHPIYRSVLASPGHWETVVVGYRSGPCY